MLGILIGITAVILTVGLGNGARADVREQINELGTNVLVISPGSSHEQQRRAGRVRLVLDADGGRRGGVGVLGRRARHRGGRTHQHHPGVVDRR